MSQYANLSYGSTSYGGELALNPIPDGLTKKRPKVLLRYGRMNEPIRVPIYDLLLDAETSYLIENANAGATTIKIENINNFKINQFLLIGTPGIENSEIVQTSATIVPAGNTVTLTAPLKFPHGSNTTVTIIDYNQIEYWQENNLAVTPTLMATLNIEADDIETKWNDTIYNVGYYKARWKNTITGLFSPYSDAVPMVSYDICMARSIMDNALQVLNKDTGTVFTDEFGFMMLNNCVMEVLREQKQWSWMSKIDTVIGTAYEGQFTMPVPPDLDDQFTDESTYLLRVGRETPMPWVDEQKFDQYLQSTGYTKLAKTAAVGDVSITLENSRDFNDSGTFQIGAFVTAYTANNKATGVLTLTNSMTTQFLAGTDVLYQPQKGLPSVWTIHNGEILIYPIVDRQRAGRNWRLSYYKKPILIKTDVDCVPFPDPTVAQYYLEWKYLLRQNNGAETPDSQAKQALYYARLEKMKQKENIGKTFQLIPRINNFAKQSYSISEDARRIRLGNYDFY